MSMRFKNVLNNANLPKPVDPFAMDFDETSDRFKQLLSIKMKEEMLSDEERTSPDTFACDCLFLRYFVTDQMQDDFSLIAKDFLLHEYPNVKDHEMVRFVEPAAMDNWPDRMFERFILNMMMNAVNHGSQYTKNLFIYLHKTYYRKEYQRHQNCEEQIPHGAVALIIYQHHNRTDEIQGPEYSRNDPSERGSPEK